MQTTFINYFTSTVVTPDHVYVITIKDPANWAARSASVNSKQDEFEKISKEYQNEFDLSWTAAQEKVLLEMYGDLINLYRADKPANSSQTTNFKNLTLNNNGTITVNPCNN